MANYPVPLILGKMGLMEPEHEASTRSSIVCQEPEAGQVKALRRKRSSDHQDALVPDQIQRARSKIQIEPRIWCYVSTQLACLHFSELLSSLLTFSFLYSHTLWTQCMMLAFLLQCWLFSTQCLALCPRLLESPETTQPLGPCCPEVKPVASTPTHLP